MDMGNLSKLVDSMIQKNREESEEAERLMDPIVESNELKAYEVEIDNFYKYIILAKEGAPFISLQEMIEQYEGATFDETGWEYLDSNTVRAICEKRSKIIMINHGEYTETLYDYVSKTKEPTVLYYY